jgi:capsular polysaccharide transport system ATP-binding protein
MIELRDITKAYHTRQGRRVVLDNINLLVRKGEKIGVVGRNGSGKSTLIRMISGAERPSSGRIVRNISVSWPLAFGGAFQHYLTGLDNLKFICRIYGKEYASLVPFVQDFTELGVYFREPLMHYSSGMRARLAFALSLAIDFDCFLIDEIIAVGDSRFHEKCRVELFEKRKDRTFIIVSHDPNMIKTHCNRAAVLTSGRLQTFESVDEAYAHYQSSMH